MSNELNSNFLLHEVKLLIEQSKKQIAVSVNSTLTLLYWEIGRRINEEIIQNQRAEYGKQIVVTLARQLTIEFGNGWSEKQLRHCIRFSEVFPKEQIVSTLSRQLSWSLVRDFRHFPFRLAFSPAGCIVIGAAFILS